MSRTGGQPDQLLLLACSTNRDNTITSSTNRDSSREGGVIIGGGNSNGQPNGAAGGVGSGSGSTVSVLYRMDVGVPLHTDRWSVCKTHP